MGILWDDPTRFGAGALGDTTSVTKLALAAALALPVVAGPHGGLPTAGTEAPLLQGGSPQAVELRAAKPSWLTPRLERRVVRAGGRPVPAPIHAPLPGFVGIRPGSWMISPFSCTMNFVFRNSGKLGIGTAGHCTKRTGQDVILLTLAPGGGGDPVLVNAGRVVVRRNRGLGNDFALVRIRPRLRQWVSPTAAVIAGPCRAYRGNGPQGVAHYGHGLGIGAGGTPRAGVALKWKRNAYGWAGAASFGDSGSPVRVAGLRAAGSLTHVLVHIRWLPNVVAGTRIHKMLRIADGWRLASSPLCV